MSFDENKNTEYDETFANIGKAEEPDDEELDDGSDEIIQDNKYDSEGLN